jgi:5-methylcytosine-specific restriction endonuclease McrA
MSPIRESERHRYPKNWREISAAVRRRNNGCCEWCDAPNGALIERLLDQCPDGKIWFEHTHTGACLGEPCPTGTVRIVLTVAHLDHTPEHCDPANLVSLCQRCHNRYDAKHRAAGRKARRERAHHHDQRTLGLGVGA